MVIIMRASLGFLGQDGLGFPFKFVLLPFWVSAKLIILTLRKKGLDLGKKGKNERKSRRHLRIT